MAAHNQFASGSESSRKLTLSSLPIIRNELYDVRSKWEDIGIELLDKNCTDAIKREKSYNLVDCLTEMLSIYLKRVSPEPSWNSIIAALRTKAVSEYQVAQELEEKYVSKTVTLRQQNLLESQAKCQRIDREDVQESSDQEKKDLTFPYLDTSKLSSHERKDLIQRLSRDYKNILERFATLQNGTCESLRKQNISAETIANTALSLALYKSDDVPRPLPAAAEILEEAKSIDRVFIYLKRHNLISYFDYGILKQIIEFHGTEDDKQKLKEYVDAFQAFCQRSVVEVPSVISECTSPTRKIFEVLITADMRSTLSDIKAAERKIADILELRHSVLALHEITPGSLVLTLSIPIQIADKVFPLRASHLTQLRANGFKFLSDEVNIGGDIEKLGDESLALCDKLKEGGDIEQNIHHLKYKIDILKILAIEQIEEVTETNEMLLADLKKLQESSSSPQLGPAEGTGVIKTEPPSPETEEFDTSTQEPDTTAATMTQPLIKKVLLGEDLPSAAATMATQSHVHVKEEPLEEVLPSAAVYSTSDDTINTETGMEIQSLGSPLALVPRPRRIMETPPISTQPTGFRGVEVCGETTVVVTNHPQSYAWAGYGLKLHIPEGCLPAGTEQCTINIKASLAGQYEFPENSYLVSAVFWFHCEIKFTKKITLEVNHCAESVDCSKLTFVRAVCSQGQLPYTFSILGGDFTVHSSYGAIELKTFCGIGAINQGSANRRYCGNLLYKEIKAAATRYVVEIYFIVLWDTEAHNNVILKYFPDTKAGLHPLPVRFKSEQLELKIQNSVEAWNVTPLIAPMVLKEDVDSFKLDRRAIPHCHLKAKFTGDLANIPDLECHVDVLGAREPHNKFTIDISPIPEASDLPPPPTSQAKGDRKRPRELNSGDYLKPELGGPLKKKHIESQRMERITLEDVAFQAGIELDALSKECSEAVLLNVAKLCVDWQLIGKHLKLTESEITAVDGNNGTVEEKRIAMLQKWKEKLAFKATYRALIEALLAAGKASCAVDIAKIIGTEKPTLKCLMKELHPKVSYKWDDVGIELEVDYGLLIQIRKDYPGDSKQCLKEVLREWLQTNNPPPSWEAIVQVMADIGEDKLATHLRSKYVLQLSHEASS